MQEQKPDQPQIPPQKILETVGRLHLQLQDAIDVNKQLAQQNQTLAAELRKALEKVSAYESTGSGDNQGIGGTATTIS